MRKYNGKEYIETDKHDINELIEIVNILRSPDGCEWDRAQDFNSMKKLIETLKNIWSVEDLRNRILFTLALAAVYRFGSFVVLPGINPTALTQLHEQTSTGLMSLLNMFSGGAFSNASIFALGIMPYISASIVIQLFAFVVPHFQKMQREGESGRRKMNQYTRWLTILILLFQAPHHHSCSR